MGLSRPTDRLLFLVYADPRAAAAAVEIGGGLRVEHGLRRADSVAAHPFDALARRRRFLAAVDGFDRDIDDVRQSRVDAGFQSVVQSS
jgi:hypothetical protein